MTDKRENNINQSTIYISLALIRTDNQSLFLRITFLDLCIQFEEKYQRLSGPWKYKIKTWMTRK